VEVLVDGKKIVLQKKYRKVGDEAPAVKIKMLNGQEKVIGMMSDKIQVMVTLPYSHSLNVDLIQCIHKHREHTNIYLISSDLFYFKVNKEYSSMDFENFTLKYGVNIDSSLCAKSIFIINKNGEIEYMQILDNLVDDFDLNKFDSELSRIINFKKKGHTHEHWMSA